MTSGDCVSHEASAPSVPASSSRFLRVLFGPVVTVDCSSLWGSGADLWFEQLCTRSSASFPPLRKCLFKALAHFLIGWFVLFLLSLRARHVLRTEVLCPCVTCKYLFQSVGCLFIVLLVSSETQLSLLLMTCSSPVIVFCGPCSRQMAF